MYVSVEWLLDVVTALWVLIMMMFTTADNTCSLALPVFLGMNLGPDLNNPTHHIKAIGVYPVGVGSH